MMKNPLEILDKFSDVNVLVVGDIMLDRFVYGHVSRISPESPVPVLSIEREDTMLGGAGNALACLVSLKTQSKVLSVIGEDDDGVTLWQKAEELGIDIDGLFTSAERPTTLKTRYLAGHQQLLRTDFEKKHALPEDIEQELLAAAKQIIPHVQAVILSDYGKGLVTRTLAQGLIKKAREHNTPIIVDPKGREFSKYAGATAITPNKKELNDASDIDVDTDENIEKAARFIIERDGVEAVIATRSKDGMSVIRGDGRVRHLPTMDIEVFDVSGAGDVVIATLGACLAAGAELEMAAGIANVAGSIAVTKVGTTPVRIDELREAVQSDLGEYQMGLSTHMTEDHTHSQTIGRKIFDWDMAEEQVKRWRARGLKVGFTNGCFDILHLGHVSYLEQARKHCDRLIVAMNTDLSVKALKGPERPVHDEKSRAVVLSGLKSVDMVTMFGGETIDADQTANEVLMRLKPDIYFKGGDYTPDEIPETPTVRSYGGEVNVMPVYEGHSTTGSIEKMKSGDKKAA